MEEGTHGHSSLGLCQEETERAIAWPVFTELALSVLACLLTHYCQELTPPVKFFLLPANYV